MTHLLKSDAWKNLNPCRAIEEKTYLKENWLGDLPGLNPKGMCHFEHSRPCKMDCRFYIHDLGKPQEGVEMDKAVAIQRLLPEDGLPPMNYHTFVNKIKEIVK